MANCDALSKSIYALASPLKQNMVFKMGGGGGGEGGTQHSLIYDHHTHVLDM